MKRFNRFDIPVLKLEKRSCFGCKHLKLVSNNRHVFECKRASTKLVRGDLTKENTPMELYAGCWCPMKEDYHSAPVRHVSHEVLR